MENGRKLPLIWLLKCSFEFGALIVFPDSNYGICKMDTRTVDALITVMISIVIRAPRKYVTEGDWDVDSASQNLQPAVIMAANGRLH